MKKDSVEYCVNLYMGAKTDIVRGELLRQVDHILEWSEMWSLYNRLPQNVLHCIGAPISETNTLISVINIEVRERNLNTTE